MTIDLRTPDAIRRRRLWIALGAVVVFATSAVLAAYADWVLWPAYSGILITIAAAGLVIVAVILAIPGRTRPLAVLVAATAVGVVAGQNLGPARPALLAMEGTITVALTAPAAVTGDAPASCSLDDPPTELQVSGDPNLRLSLSPVDVSIPPEVDQREFVQVSLTVGDRWTPGPEPRSDATYVGISINGVRADAPETRMISGVASPMELRWDADGGSLVFRDLIPDTRFSDAGGPPIDLAGSISWTCDAPEPPQ